MNIKNTVSQKTIIQKSFVKTILSPEQSLGTLLTGTAVQQLRLQEEGKSKNVLYTEANYTQAY